MNSKDCIQSTNSYLQNYYAIISRELKRYQYKKYFLQKRRLCHFALKINEYFFQLNIYFEIRY